MAPGLVGTEKAECGKLPTDVWWHTIVGTSAHERTGYPTQKPIALAERIIRASNDRDELVLGPFAGSGTVGAAARRLDRRFLLIDRNPESIAVMSERLPGVELVSQAQSSSGCDSDRIQTVMLGAHSFMKRLIDLVT